MSAGGEVQKEKKLTQDVKALVEDITSVDQGKKKKPQRKQAAFVWLCCTRFEKKISQYQIILEICSYRLVC